MGRASRATICRSSAKPRHQQGAGARASTITSIGFRGGALSIAAVSRITVKAPIESRPQITVDNGVGAG